MNKTTESGAPAEPPKAEPLKAHWVAEIFPFSQADVDRMADDIKANGQFMPIVLYNNEIIDGRLRYAACRKAGVQPIFREVPTLLISKNGKPTDNELLAYSWSLNDARRHLSISQRACAAAEVLERRGVKRGGNRRGNKVDQSTLKQDDVAQVYSVGRDSVMRAREILKSKPELFAKIKNGETTIGEAWNSLQQKQKPEEKASDESIQPPEESAPILPVSSSSSFEAQERKSSEPKEKSPSPAGTVRFPIPAHDWIDECCGTDVVGRAIRNIYFLVAEEIPATILGAVDGRAWWTHQDVAFRKRILQTLAINSARTKEDADRAYCAFHELAKCQKDEIKTDAPPSNDNADRQELSPVEFLKMIKAVFVGTDEARLDLEVFNEAAAEGRWFLKKPIGDTFEAVGVKIYKVGRQRLVFRADVVEALAKHSR